ncbi:MAG: Holliday junction resolvase RuvX [Ruaniaceae bacterium]|nr:Holliday junction resolvase RuvX [Ruaniaceae bacterium]
MRTGVRLGVDVGQVRIGIARSDSSGSLVVPVSTIRRDGSDLARIAGIARKYEVIEIVVGLPLGLSGKEGSASERARHYAGMVAGRTGVPVRLVDERLSTVSAHAALHEAGLDSRKHRAVVDQVAATVILEQALAIERSTGNAPGEPWKDQT